MQLFVDANHRIVTNDKPFLTVRDCSTSGFGAEEVFDYMFQGLTWMISGGETSFGLYDAIGGFATIAYDFFAGVSQSDIALTREISTEILNHEMLKFVSQLHEIDVSENELYLDRIRYDTKYSVN
ncbi:hypothetical protein KFU94_30415 [Chloroflexi bacterium TSY]|nr:hypothetical protein [Chloroflexi bacterium TSY]MBV7332467.1 hypothetical protein [Chloroflexi bacterium TSY]